MLYKSIIRLFSTETAFRIMMLISRILSRLHLVRYAVRFFHPTFPSLRREVFGMSFNGPIGLGPGLDRKGELYNVFTDFGFSYVNVGPMDADTVRHAIDHIQKYPLDKDTHLAVCINKDHNTAFSLAYDFFDMFVLDIQDERISDVLEQVLNTRLTYDDYKPVILRITHDMPESFLRETVHYCMMNGVDGFLAAKEENVKKIKELTLGRVPIIGYGGIRNALSARNMFDAGASLVEITSGFVLDGASLVHRILKSLDRNKV